MGSARRSGRTADAAAPPADTGEPLDELVPADPPRLASRPARVREFLRRIYEKAGDDNIFFMAGAIAFNLLVAIVPLLLFAVGVSALVLSARYGDPATAIVAALLDYLPAIGGDIALISTVESQINAIIEERSGFTIIGAVLLVWFSTRLVGTLRTVLREVFDIGQDRGIVGGKIFDAKAVVIGGLFVLVNLGVTTWFQAAQQYGVSVLGLEGYAVSALQQAMAFGLSFLSIWVLFVGIYRYLPARWIPWRTALIAATFTAVLHELLKYGFGWYVTDVANYGSTYGNLLTIAILFFWIYYESLVFILGGEIAQVWTMRRARKVRTRSALFPRTS